MACSRCQDLREGVLIEAYHNDEWIICSILSCGYQSQNENDCNFYMFLIKVNTKTTIDPICCNQYKTKWKFLPNARIVQPMIAKSDSHNYANMKITSLNVPNIKCADINNVSRSECIPKKIMKSQETQTLQSEEKLDNVDSDFSDLLRFGRNLKKRKRPKEVKNHNITNNNHNNQMIPRNDNNPMSTRKKRRIIESVQDSDDKQLDHYIKCLIGHALGDNDVGFQSFVEHKPLNPIKKKKKREIIRPKKVIKSMNMDIDELSFKEPKTNIVTGSVICPVCSKSYQKRSHLTSHIAQKKDALHRDYCRKKGFKTY